MTVKIDKDLCAGCGICVDACPEVFEIVDNLAVAKVNPIPAASQAHCREAAENCPVDAIVITDK